MEESYEKVARDVGSKCYANQILRDYATEPTIVCDVNKRRKCDSAYISLYNKLLKDFTKLKAENEELKQLVNIYKEIMDESIDTLKGGE